MVHDLPKTLFSFIRHFVGKQKTEFVLSLLGGLAWTLDYTLWPVVFMVLVDTLNSNADQREGIFQALVPLLIFGAFLFFLIDFGYRLSGFMMAKALPKIEADVRMETFEYVQHHSYHYFSNQFAGSLANKLNDLPSSITRILQLVINLFVPVAAAACISILLFAKVAPFFALLLVLSILTHLSISFYFLPYTDTLSKTHAEAKSTLSGKVVDSLTNHLNVKLFSRFREESAFVSKYQNEERIAHQKVLTYVEKIKILIGISGFFFTGICLTTYLISTWRSEEITTGEVVFILNSWWNINTMTWLTGLELPNLFKDIGIAKQALSLIEAPHEIVDRAQAKELQVHQGKITFDHVFFRHKASRALFENLSLTIDPGEKVGLVGFSGSGKTSFINLILRHFEVDQGAILIDDQDIRTVTQSSLRKAIGMIPQEPVLFHRTLMENVRYGREGATDDEVIEACKRAHCHEFILSLKEEYHTIVGERGLKLSGGQRQRIAIARAILKNAPILILDEATSALDSVTERLIQEDLKNLMEEKTTVVIAHRLSTLATVDRILVFDHGQIIEQGTHESLILSGGRYKEMWQMQAGGFLPN